MWCGCIELGLSGGRWIGSKTAINKAVAVFHVGFYQHGDQPSRREDNHGATRNTHESVVPR